MFKKTVTLDEEQVFTDDEIRKITAWITVDSERLQSLSNLGILFDFYTGLRAGELSTLKYSDFEGNILTVKRTETRIIPMSMCPKIHFESLRAQFYITIRNV